MSNIRPYIPTPEEASEIEAGLDELDRGESVSLEDVMRGLRAIREEDAELDAAIAEAELGGGVSAEQVLRELRARRR